MTSLNGGQADRLGTDTQDEATRRHIVSDFPALCMSVVGPDGRVITCWVGEGYARLSGYEVEELETDPGSWHGMVHPADSERVRDAYRRLAAVGRMHEQYRIYRKDGQMRTVLETGTAGEPGEAGTWVLRCLSDISAAGSQIESAVSFRELVDETPVGVGVRDLTGRLVYCNRAYVGMFGYDSPEHMIGTDLRDIMAPKTLEEFRERAFPRILEGAWSGEVSFQRKDGKVLDLKLSTNVFRDPEGNPVAAHAIILDITELRQTENALRESEDRYHSLLENLDAVVFRMGAGMRLLTITGRVEAMLGYDRDELLASPSLWRDVVHPDDLDEAVRLMKTARETRSPQCTETRVRHRSGGIVWMRGTLTPIFDDHGEFVYWDGVWLDITERVEAQERDARHTTRMRILTETSQQCGSSLDSRQILDTVTQQVCRTLDCVAAGVNVDPLSGRLLNLSLCCPHGCDVKNLDREIRTADLGVEKVFGMMDVVPRIVPDLSRSSPALARFAKKGGLEPGMIAPVTAGEEVVGVLLGARRAGEQFDEEDLWFLTEVASHASAALANSALYRRQARIAETLQRTLIPPEPAVGFLDIATLYAPAPGEARVGGDFFDVFRLDGKKVGLVVGDVSGKGVEAAIHTAEAKYMLRAFAHQNPEPLHVVTSLNAALFDYLPGEAFITLVYLVIDAENHTMTYVNAGHETSFVLRGDEQITSEIGPSGPMLGVTASVAYAEGQADLGPNDLLFCYTDGVTDVRTDGKRFGFARLRETIASAPAGDAHCLMDFVMERVRSFGAAKQTDDQVVVVVRPLG